MPGRDVLAATLAVGAMLAFGLSAAATPAAAVADGTLDASYGNAGSATATFGSDWAAGHDAAIYADQTLIVGGVSGPAWALARFDTTGAPDPGLGGDGKVSVEMGNGGVADAVVVLPDGRILVGGDASGNGSPERPYLPRFALARFEQDGGLDPSFGTGGKVLTPVGGDPNATGVGGGIQALAIQPDGKIVAAGYAYWSGAARFVIARYMSSGELDADFGSGGVTDVSFAPESGFPRGVIVQPSGRIVVAGYSYSQGLEAQVFTLAGLTSTGALDSTFGSGGIVLTSIAGGGDEAAAEALLQQPDGKLVAAGWTSLDPSGAAFAVARYDAEGVLDPGFGTGGTVVTQINAKDAAEGYDVHLQNDGKLVVAGRTENADTIYEDAALVRYTAAGSLDPTFGAGGIVTNGAAGTSSWAVAIVGQSDGKVVTAGFRGDDMLAQRFTAGPPPPEPPEPPDNTEPPTPAPACKTTVVENGSVEAHASCFTLEADRWAATDRVRVNGIDVVPAEGSTVLVDPVGRRLTTRGDAEVKIGNVALYKGPVDLDLASSARLNANVPNARLGPFPLVGQVTLAFGHRETKADLPVRLPASVGGGTVLGKAAARGPFGLDLGSLKIAFPTALLGSFELSSTEIEFTPGDSGWHGALKLELPGLPPRPRFDASLGISNAGRVRVDVSVANSNLGFIPGAAGVITLRGAQLTLRDAPVTFGGGVSVSSSLLPVVDFDGSLTYTHPAIFTVRGASRLFGILPLSNGAIRTDLYYSKDVKLRGGIDWTFMPAVTVPGFGHIPEVALRGQLEGYVNWGQSPRFGAIVNGRLVLNWITIPAEAYLTNNRIGACGIVGFDTPLGTVSLALGIAVTFSPHSTQLMGGINGYCDWGTSSILGPGAGGELLLMGAGREASLNRTFGLRVLAGNRGIALAAVGRTRPPNLVISGPRGERIRTTGRPKDTRRSGHIVFHDSKTTHVVIARPRPGRWTIAPAPGSSIASIRRSDALPVLTVKASVGGKGAIRKLRWRIRNIPGQRVRFTDEGQGRKRVLVTTRRLRGSMRFRPLVGSGRRTIVAWVERNGLARKRIVVARYKAPARPRLVKPKQLRARIAASTLRVSWRRTAGASRYLVRARLADGRVLVRLVRRPSAAFAEIARQSATITVQALDPLNRRGPAATVRIR